MALPQASFDDLPPSVHLSVLLLIPLVQRVRLALVSRRWAALLREPALWSQLDLEGVRRGAGLLADADSFLGICRRAEGQLRLLDLSDLAFGEYNDGGEEEAPPSALPLLERMAAEGLTAKLESLRILDPETPDGLGRLILRNAEDARRLRAALPALQAAAVLIRGGWQDVAAALRALSCGGANSVVIAAHHSPSGRKLQASAEATEAVIRSEFVAFATALSEALQCCSVASLDLGSVHDDTTEENRLMEYYKNYFGVDALFARAGDPAAVAQAAARLAAVLASREHGPCRLRLLATPPGRASVAVSSAPSGFSRLLFGALTPESPLKYLFAEASLNGDAIDRETVDELAAALAPGRAPPIERITLRSWRVMEAGGTGALLSALGRSPTLTRLSLETCKFGHLGMSTLGQALRNSPKLKRLSLCQPFNGEDSDREQGPPGVLAFFDGLNAEAADRKKSAGEVSGASGSGAAGAAGPAPAEAVSSPVAALASATAGDGESPSPPSYSLKRMDLVQLEWDDAAAAALSRCLEPRGILHALHSLNITGDKGIDEISKHVCKVLVAGGAQLRTVDIVGDYTGCRDAAALAFAEALKQPDCPLVELNLVLHDGITATGGAQLIASTCNADLHHHSYGIALARALAENSAASRLNRLSLSNTVEWVGGDSTADPAFGPAFGHYPGRCRKPKPLDEEIEPEFALSFAMAARRRALAVAAAADDGEKDRAGRGQLEVYLHDFKLAPITILYSNDDFAYEDAAEAEGAAGEAEGGGEEEEEEGEQPQAPTSSAAAPS